MPYLAVRWSLCWVSCNYGGAVRVKSSEQARQLQRIESFDGCPATPYNAFRQVSMLLRGECSLQRGRLVSTGVDGRRMRCRAPLTRKTGGKTQLRTRSSLSQLNNL